MRHTITTALLWLALAAIACWSQTPHTHISDPDPVRAHFYRARATFAVMCDCAQDAAAFERVSAEVTAEIDGGDVAYNPQWMRAQMARHGDDAAFAVFAHELAHIEHSARRLVTGFARGREIERWCDYRAGCATAVAGASMAQGASLFGSFMGDMLHDDGYERAQTFVAGYESCAE